MQVRIPELSGPKYLLFMGFQTLKKLIHITIKVFQLKRKKAKIKDWIHKGQGQILTLADLDEMRLLGFW